MSIYKSNFLCRDLDLYLKAFIIKDRLFSKIIKETIHMFKLILPTNILLVKNNKYFI